jgi:cation transporter-like permease
MDNPKQVEHGKHWHYIYAKHRRRQRILGINPRQMAWSQVFSLVGSVIAGALLESNKATLALIAGAFVILPGIFDLNGTLGAGLSAKINHRLEDQNAQPFSVFIRSFGFALFVAVTGGLLVAGVGAAIAYTFFDAGFWQVFVLAELAIILAALFGLPFIGLLSLLFRSRNINPDDVVGPIESSVFDILTVVMMVVVIGWLT